MPTNLPPEYFEAEKRFKDSVTPEEKTQALEELISRIPKHKGTDKLRAEYRKKLSKFKSQSQSKKNTAKHDSHFKIEKEGDGRIVVVGAANVGKSSLVSYLTNAEPEVSEAPYSTWVPTPGILEFKGIHLQLIDTPPIDRNYIEPEFVDLLKSADLILLMVDLQAFPIPQFQQTVEVLESNRIFARIKKTDSADPRNYFIPIVVLVNKDDTEGFDEDFEVLNELLKEEGWAVLPISIKAGRNIDEAEQFIIRELEMIRIYSKPPGEEPDLTQPFVLHSGSTLEEFAAKVHRDFAKNLKSAKLWGKRVHDGQMVGRDHILYDGDIVELHI
ncbi:MAG: TGS domain-containing protein [Ignavibacteriae bacterium]|nr:TGS domain-containing protein [Ignavibacteriota bacterium]NOG99159.1 TGS domain-containing protein [Ignavibacteriota bacterium]